MAQTYSKESALQQIVDYLGDVQGEIIDQILKTKMNASGKTAASLEVVPSNTGGSLMAAQHIIFLETGRPPTKDGAATGNPTLLEIIKQWVIDKGVDANPYAITKTIHKEGTRLYRQGGKSGVLSIPLRLAGLNTLFAEIATQYSQVTSSEIYEPINELQNA